MAYIREIILPVNDSSICMTINLFASMAPKQNKASLSSKLIHFHLIPTSFKGLNFIREDHLVVKKPILLTLKFFH